jgi:hypothetical protein
VQPVGVGPLLTKEKGMSKRGQINPATGITDGKMRTLIKSNLRTIWRNTSRKQFILSKRRRAINPKTGRMWNVLDCAECGRVMGVSEKERRVKKDGGLEKRAKSVYEINHIHGIAPLADIRETLGDYWHDLIYGESEVLCVACHKAFTQKENKQRRENKKKGEGR